MTTVFDAIIRQEIAAQVVWEDAMCMAFLDDHPHTDGHTLVIPLREVARWTDLTDAESAHLFWVAKQIGRAQLQAFHADRIGLVVAGYHVDHVHVHVFPTSDASQLDFSTLPEPPLSSTLEVDGDRLRHALRRRGFGIHVPPAPEFLP
ncbi:MAG TPA: HIT family protein [Humibacter sp.]|jgi:histidine triad (HIT) family protein|nr:HIT family protein [Humibacter sp.]